MSTPFLSHFTPSLMSHQALESIFVQRQSIVERLVEQTRDSTLSKTKHYNLLIGPRGIGKTHTVALVYYRVQAMDDLQDRLRIAWMREEEWGVTSFLDWLLRIFRALQSEYPGEIPTERIEALYLLAPAAAQHHAEKLLQEVIGKRTLLLLIENLDDLFEGLGDKGQKQFRAFLQENEFCTIVATAQCLFNGVSRQTSPFYGFFRIQHLKGLEIEDVTQLLTNIAEFKQDRELASFIGTATGRARIRAVHHLAGGNHRVYVIFSQFLNRASLDALVQPFMNMLDELTPYYQARMAWLSPQQRKIVEFLCDRRGAAPVKEIAQRGFMSQQTTSSQLQDLRDKGYVQAESAGRESFYELREPLMRLCIEVKKNRGGPIQLFVDFLRLWYSRDELQQRLYTLQPEAIVEREYVGHALEIAETESEDPVVAACQKDFQRNVDENNFEAALKVAEELVAIRGTSEDWVRQWFVLHNMGQNKLALIAINKAFEIDPENTYLKYFRGSQLGANGRPAEALAVFDDIIATDPEYVSTTASLWVYHGAALIDLGRYEEALASIERSLKIDPNDRTALSRYSIVLIYLRRNYEALEVLEKLLSNYPEDNELWMNKGIVLADLNQYEAALEVFDQMIKAAPDTGDAWHHRSMVLSSLDRSEEALVSSHRALELDANDPKYWGFRAYLLSSLERHQEALHAWQMAIKFEPDDGTLWGWQGRTLLTLNRFEEALHSFEQATKKQSNFDTFDIEHALTLMRLERFEAAFAILDNLSFAEKQLTLDDTWQLLLAFGYRQDKHSEDEITNDDWENYCTKIAIIYEKHGQLPLLAQAMLRFVSVMLSNAGTTPEYSSAWLEMWRGVVGERAELQLPLRLMDAAIQFAQSGDQRVLLALPIEERKILQEMLDENAAETAE